MLSAKTIAEMKAGAEQAASHRQQTLKPGELERLMNIYERQRTLVEWERRGWITIRKNTKLQRMDNDDVKIRWTSYIVEGMDVEFEDRGAEELGASPSELLIAQVALALASQGRML